MVAAAVVKIERNATEPPTLFPPCPMGLPRSRFLSLTGFLFTALRLTSAAADPAWHAFHHEHVLGTSLELRFAASKAGDAQRAEAAALAEIDRLPGTIDAEEVGRVKARARSGLVMQQESSAARAGAIARQWYHLGSMRTLGEELARYDRLGVGSIEAWLAANPVRDLSVVSLGREPLEVPHEVSA